MEVILLPLLRAHLAFLKWWLFKQKKSVFPEQKRENLAGVYKGNVVWQHFVKKKKYFSEIVDKIKLDFIAEPLFLHHKLPDMNYQQEYQQELQKVQDKDFTHNWVSSSAFLFYLQVVCIVAFVLAVVICFIPSVLTSLK